MDSNNKKIIHAPYKLQGKQSIRVNFNEDSKQYNTFHN